MADKNIFDKAENLARRLFERLGSKLDDKIASENQTVLSSREIEDIISKMERAIDANLKPDTNGVKRIAPNSLKVLFPYERFVNFTPKYLEALTSELKASIYEYVVNRRYELQEQMKLGIAADYFEPSTVIRAGFESKEARQSRNTQPDQPYPSPQGKSPDISHLRLRNEAGESFNFELKAGSAPISIGRSSSNRIRLQDASVSREHCSIARRQDGQLVIADLGSANGTAVNSSQLRENEARTIKQGDVISVGDVRLTIVEIV